MTVKISSQKLINWNRFDNITLQRNLWSKNLETEWFDSKYIISLKPGSRNRIDSNKVGEKEEAITKYIIHVVTKKAE